MLQRIAQAFRRRFAVEDTAKTRATMLDDLRGVGPSKPMGYLPIDTITDYCGADVDDLARELNARGLLTVRLDEDACGVGSGALYCHDPAALQSLLDRKAEALNSFGWPTEAHAFVLTVALETAEGGTELFDIVADAFGDTDNPLRRRR